jgi:hypothetical protein
MALAARGELSAHPAALAGFLLAACAAACGGPARPERTRDSPAAYALPEPDPSCRARAQAPLRAAGLEQVAIRVEVSSEGRLVLVEFLEPDLSPAARLELRQAMEQCIWKPVLDAQGRPQGWVTRLVRTRP